MIPARSHACVAALAAALLLAPPSALSSYRNGFKGSWGHRTPVLLHGATLGAGTAQEARDRSRRLGFALLDDGNRDRAGMPAIPLHEGRLEWSLGAGGPFAMLDTRALAPLLHTTFVKAGDGSVGAIMGGDPTLGHPNHATRLVGVVGIVGDVDEAVFNLERQAPFADDKFPIRFGRTYRLDAIGARAADAALTGGRFVRLIAPRGETSPCAAWRGAGFGRWVGLVFESDDVAATASWFESYGVPFARSGFGLALDPETTGGIYMEFVPKGASRS